MLSTLRHRRCNASISVPGQNTSLSGATGTMERPFYQAMMVSRNKLGIAATKKAQNSRSDRSVRHLKQPSAATLFPRSVAEFRLHAHPARAPLFLPHRLGAALGCDPVQPS